MKVWTKEERRRTLKESDLDELEELHQSIEKSKWRCDYHIQTVTGLMNDPNGFSYYNGKWHLFYQWFPYGAVHGNKHWYHVVSDDLVTWTNMGVGMIPDTDCDNCGCYSGSALCEDDVLYLAYTGNHRDENDVRIPYQMLAKYYPNGCLAKYPEPIIFPEKGYTEHQRDPKLIYRKEEGKYNILLGAQRTDGRGVFLLYESEQIDSGWQLVGEMKIEGYDDLGFMVECPDLEKMQDKWLLIFAPQGIHPEGEGFENKYNNVYFIGDMDFENCTFKPDGPYRELDRGFDFYASQCAYQKDDDKAYLVGWFGCSDYTYPPTDEEGWAGLITMVRQLTIEDGVLRQRPVKDFEKIKGQQLFLAKNGEILENHTVGTTPDACVIEVKNPDNESLTLNLFARMNQKGFEIAFSKIQKTLTINRSGMTNSLNTEYGTVRTVHTETLHDLLVFVDHSTVEIFANDGEFVLSSRVFPNEDEHQLRMGGKNIDMTIWQANRTVTDDFIIAERTE